MKRCILVGSRTNKDKETGDELLFLTLCNLPRRMKNGGLWNPKSNEMLVTSCINKARKPDDYDKFIKLLPGTLFDVTYGVNEFTGKVVVAALNLVAGSDNIFDEKTLFDW